MLPAFDLWQPKTIDEALEILSATPGSRPIAGGTHLIPTLRRGGDAPGALVDVSRLRELCCIREKDGHLLIGGGVKLAELLDDPMISRDAPILAEMARSFANALVRNRATIAGNLVAAAPCCDAAPALSALDAEVELASRAGARRVPLAGFFVGPFATRRKADELLTCVRVPILSERSFTGFRKMGLRKISCMAKIDVAVRVDVDRHGRCAAARIALGAVGPITSRADAAEAHVVAKKLDRGTIDQAAHLAANAASPRRGSEYKLRIVETLTKRLLREIAGRIEGRFS